MIWLWPCLASAAVMLVLNIVRFARHPDQFLPTVDELVEGKQ